MGHSWRMRVLLLLILPVLLQGKSIIKERNDVIKQALIPTLVNIIGHARMEEHGIGDNMDGLLDFMDEEKILDPFLQWLGWFTDIVVEKEEPADSGESEESRSIVRERNDVIKQALIPTLVNIIRHARMQEHGVDIDEILDYMDEENILDPFLKWLGWFTDMELEKEEGENDKSNESDESMPIESDEATESGELEEYEETALELEVLEKEESMEESIKKMVEEEENYHGEIPQDEKVEEEVLEKEESLEESLEDEIYDDEVPENLDDEIYDNKAPEIPEDEIYDDEIPENLDDEIYDNKAPGIPEDEIYDDEAPESLEDEIYEGEAPETEHEKPAMWPGDPKGYNGPMIPEQDNVPEDLIEEGVPLRWA